MHLKTVCVIGADDVGTACALRLYRAGFGVLLIEKQSPADIYHHRNFSAAVFSGKKSISEITARTLAGAIEIGNVTAEVSVKDFVTYQLANREIALLTLDQISELKNYSLNYTIISTPDLFSFVANILPQASKRISIGRPEEISDFNYVIAADTLYSGQVIYPSIKEEFLQVKKVEQDNKDIGRIKAPLEGVFSTLRRIDDFVMEKEELGRINDIPILAPTAGHISGLLNSGLMIEAKTVFAEINSQKEFISAAVIPPKAFGLAGGVLEAILYDLNL